MIGGFSFCGVDIADIGLEYAPENADTYVYRPAPWRTFDESIDVHHGGYHYGDAAEVKEFTLRCFYEEKHVSHGIMTSIFNLFQRGRTGKLIFKRRPWCYYVATVSELPDTSELSNYMNGFVTIHMKAYYPFARSDVLQLDLFDENALDMLENTALLYRTGQQLSTSFIPVSNLSNTILLHNPGTERAPCGIAIAGNAVNGVIIANTTTGESAKFIGLSTQVLGSKYILSDGMNGKTVITNGSTSDYGFMYHDYGFISLESGYPIDRNVNVSYNGSAITIPGGIKRNVVGKHVWLNNQWRKIVTQPTPYSITVNPAPSGEGQEVTDITQMNEINITPVGNCSLTRLEFIYTPTYT